MNLNNEYIKLRSYLWAVAYDMTGDIQQAEDIVQDGFEIISRLKGESVTNPKAYFTRIIINKSIDRQKELQKQRISYPGTWLPEPYITDPDEPFNESILPYAMMHLAEQLNPVERAVFILREAFSYSYAEIADFCNISEDNCRQLLHRSKGKIKRNKSGSKRMLPQTLSLTEAFLKSSLEANHEELKSLLQEDIRLYSDGGGKAVAARNILEGKLSITKFFIGITQKSKDSWRESVRVHINNGPGLLIYENGIPDFIVTFEDVQGKIASIFIVRNPEKISHLNLSQKSPSADI